MRESFFILFLMIIIVPLTGELKLYLFNNAFRVSLGSAAFLFFLLWIRRVPQVLYGFVVGLCVVCFRFFLDWIFKVPFLPIESLRLHIPAFFYYLAFSLLFYAIKVNKFHDKPFLLGFLCVLIDITSNILELLIRYFYLNNQLTLGNIGQIIIIATIRCFFVLSFFNIIKLREATLYFHQQQQQNRHMLLLISNLYAESIHLKKSLKDAETITRDCYELYRDIQANGYELKTDELSQKLLTIAGQVHEIKKDNQRIYAGLSKMITQESSQDYMDISEICNIIIKTNTRYALSLNKSIEFILNIDNGLPHFHVYTILSLINNLVSNSVESIKECGFIDLSVKKIDDFVEFKIRDNGPGIVQKKLELIFKPGYTTKYDIDGKPSTGMGLPYVKSVVESLNGNLIVNSNPDENETNFIIQLPINRIAEKG
ncbi:sensor histidine kinase [Fervidicella metallireducens AeB]|uniref:histidine kinase n=1 Tax=Fervidicella metallireducens AeB TaxID=1403537 RepID=A0A017RVX5_9CLOT|nr:sensor histidine kinase [Fervidicella metallireducens AeB]